MNIVKGSTHIYTNFDNNVSEIKLQAGRNKTINLVGTIEVNGSPIGSGAVINSNSIVAFNTTEPCFLYNDTTSDVFLASDSNSLTLGSSTGSSVLVQDISAIDPALDTNLFGDTTADINIGALSDTVVIGNAGSIMRTQDINCISDTTDFVVASQLTSGTLKIGPGLTSGSLEFGNSSSITYLQNLDLFDPALNFNVASNITTGWVKFGTSLTTTYLQNIDVIDPLYDFNIGSNVTGSVILGTTSSITSVQKLDPIDPVLDFDIGDSLTSGSLNIASNLTSGSINVGTVATNCIISSDVYMTNMFVKNIEIDPSVSPVLDDVLKFDGTKFINQKSYISATTQSDFVDYATLLFYNITPLSVDVPQKQVFEYLRFCDKNVFVSNNADDNDINHYTISEGAKTLISNETAYPAGSIGVTEIGEVNSNLIVEILSDEPYFDIGTYTIERYSTDGMVSWTTISEASGFDVTSSSYKEGAFIYTNSNGTGRIRLYTGTGSFTSITTADALSITDSIYSDSLGLFIVMGPSTTSGVYTSPTGSTWTVRTTPNTTCDRLIETLTGIIGYTSSNSTSTVIIRSTDGITWTSHTVSGYAGNQIVYNKFNDCFLSTNGWYSDDDFATGTLSKYGPELVDRVRLMFFDNSDRYYYYWYSDGEIGIGDDDWVNSGLLLLDETVLDITDVTTIDLTSKQIVSHSVYTDTLSVDDVRIFTYGSEEGSVLTYDSSSVSYLPVLPSSTYKTCEKIATGTQAFTTTATVSFDTDFYDTTNGYSTDATTYTNTSGSTKLWYVSLTIFWKTVQTGGSYRQMYVATSADTNRYCLMINNTTIADTCTTASAPILVANGTTLTCKVYDSSGNPQVFSSDNAVFRSRFSIVEI